MINILNISLKLSNLLLGSLVFFFPLWPQFLEKAMPFRFFWFTIFSFIIPLIWFLKGRKSPYPHAADFVFAFPFFLDLFGNAAFLFWTPWYDDFTHFFNTVVFGFFFLCLIMAFHPKVNRLLLGFATVGIVMTAHVIWEFIEYALQFIYGENLYLTYTDTLSDLGMGVLGGMVILLISFSRFWNISWVKERLVGPLTNLK